MENIVIIFILKPIFSMHLCSFDFPMKNTNFTYILLKPSENKLFVHVYVKNVFHFKGDKKWQL